MKAEDVVVLVTVALGLAMTIATVTQCSVDKSWRKQIAEHGCAEFYLDANHDRQWKWK